MGINYLFIIIVTYLLFSWNFLEVRDNFGNNELDFCAQVIIWYTQLQKKKAVQEGIIDITKYWRDCKWDVGGKMALDLETKMPFLTLDVTDQVE